MNNSLPKTFKNVSSKLLKMYFNGSIAAKAYQGTTCNLYYEQSQHLMFAFKRSLTYEPIVQSKLQEYICPGNLVFDIGGNIGQYALRFSELVGSNGKVISLEPDSKNFSFLQFNLNMNGISNVACLKKGLGHMSETTEFYRDSETGGRKGSFNVTFVGNNFKGSVEQVEVITFDKLVDECGYPDFVKIDVEGFETNVLKGLTYSLEKTVFLVEVREETKEFVFDYFQARDFDCYHVDFKEDVQITEVQQIPDFANLIFKKR